MSNVCLIFGGNSQDGYYLSEQCRQKGMQVISVSRTTGSILGDVSDYQFVADLIKLHRPLYVFHLAANSTTRHDAMLENYHTICIGTFNVLEAVKCFSPESKVFITGSGLQFKNTGQPISEHNPLVSDSAYSVVRNSSVECARYYRSLGIAVYIGYLFHHESPLRKPNHVSKMIALAAQRIAQGSDEILEIGDLTVKKEWAFAGDITQGMLTLMSQEHVFEAVIGTGEGHTIEEWLNACFSVANLDWQAHVSTREGFISEYPSLISDPRTMFGLGWRPSTSFGSLAEMMMSDNRSRIMSWSLECAGIGGLEHNDFNHVLHHLRGVALKKLPKNVDKFISVGCAGAWYFRWIEDCCGPIGHHIGIEYYTPKPDDLPSKVEWIVNTAGDMSLIDDATGDVLFSGQNIEHLWPSEVADFLRESYRVLKPNGLLVIDSPNRLVTQQLGWSHPEHTIELTPEEARCLVELSGFEVTALHGMWLCADTKRSKILQLDDFRTMGQWSVSKRVSEAHTRPNESFCWWIEARKINRTPDMAKIDEAISAIFHRAWPERVNRFLTLVGDACVIEGRRWLRSNGESGVLMYGPYMPLPEGEYTVCFELRRGDMFLSSATAEVARVDVITGSGLELASCSICADQMQLTASTFFSLTFMLDTMTFGIQFRIIVSGAEQIIAHRAIELKCNNNATFDVEF